MPYEGFDPSSLSAMLAGGELEGQAIMPGASPPGGPGSWPTPEMPAAAAGGGAGDIWKKYLAPFLMSGAPSTIVGAMMPESPMGRVGLATGQMLQARTMSEQYKNLLRSMLAGKEGTESPFVGSPTTGGPIGSIEALGLTPQVVEKFYGTALEQVEKARRAPLEEMLTVAQAEHARAGAMHNFAEALKVTEALGFAGEERVQKALELLRKQQETTATVAEKGAQTERIKEETKNIPVQRRKLGAEATKIEREAEELTPGARKLEEESKIRVGRATQPAQIVPMGGQIGQLTPFPTTERMFPVTPKPGEGLPTQPQATQQAMGHAAAHIAPILEAQLDKQLGVGKGKIEMENLRRTLGMRPDLNTNEEMYKLLTPENQNKFRDVLTMYQVGITGGMAVNEIGRMVEAKMAAPTPAAVGVKADPKETFKSFPKEEQEAILAFVERKYKTSADRNKALQDIINLAPEKRRAAIGAKPPGAPAKLPVQAPKPKLGAKESVEGAIAKRLFGPPMPLRERLRRLREKRVEIPE